MKVFDGQCPFCHKPMFARDRECAKCGTSIPSGAKRTHVTKGAPPRRIHQPRDDHDANGLANAMKALEDQRA